MFAPEIPMMTIKTARRRIKLIGEKHPLFKSLKHYIHESKCRNQKNKKWKQRRVKQFRIKKIKLPLIRKVWPKLIAEDLISVQPMKGN